MSHSSSVIIILNVEILNKFLYRLVIFKYVTYYIAVLCVFSFIYLKIKHNTITFIFSINKYLYRMRFSWNSAVTNDTSCIILNSYSPQKYNISLTI